MTIDAPYLNDGDVVLHNGDCMDAMRAMPPESVHAVVTDPPYGLEFMGRDWDRFRVDDPGTTRHRGERAGAHGEQLDAEQRRNRRATVVYGAGKRPKTYRCTGCGKRDQFRNDHGCDAARWAPELIDPYCAPPTSLAFQNWTRLWATEAMRVLKPGGYLLAFGAPRTFHRLASGLEDAGFDVRDTLSWLFGQGFPKSLNLDGEWEGHGTALKPGWEPIIMARKPSPYAVAATMDQHGVGALSIEVCRIDSEPRPLIEQRHGPEPVQHTTYGARAEGSRAAGVTEEGRWPANVVVDADAALVLDADAGEPVSRFYYTAKASTAERNHGGARNDHPTVKPIALMRWCVRLVTRPGQTVLDPFGGSGTTGLATRAEGRRAILIEQSPDYCQIIAQRLSQLSLLGLLDTVEG